MKYRGSGGGTGSWRVHERTRELQQVQWREAHVKGNTQDARRWRIYEYTIAEVEVGGKEGGRRDARCGKLPLLFIFRQLR